MKTFQTRYITFPWKSFFFGIYRFVFYPWEEKREKDTKNGRSHRFFKARFKAATENCPFMITGFHMSDGFHPSCTSHPVHKLPFSFFCDSDELCRCRVKQKCFGPIFAPLSLMLDFIFSTETKIQKGDCEFSGSRIKNLGDVFQIRLSPGNRHFIPRKSNGSAYVAQPPRASHSQICEKGGWEEEGGTLMCS